MKPPWLIYAEVAIGTIETREEEQSFRKMLDTLREKLNEVSNRLDEEQEEEFQDWIQSVRRKSQDKKAVQ